jgi:D-amino-acid oxidase
MARVTVVGAGVVGLSCAVRLLEAGHRVDVLARELPAETTSAVAAAIWYPYLAQPRDRVLAWGATSYAEFARLAAEEPEAGIALRRGTEAFREVEPQPWWAAAVPDLEPSGEVPHGYRSGWSFTAPVVEMPVYLRWLAGRVRDLGGSLTRLTVPALPVGPDLVVNCSGLGARLLAADHDVVPVRGQVVLVEQFGLERWWLDGSGPAYVIPRSRDIVVGGTEGRGEWSPTPAPATAERILEHARELVPELASARVVGHRVGLRPARPSVRLERDGSVLHCYGHGGSGVTISWGCAGEVAALAEESLG